MTLLVCSCMRRHEVPLVKAEEWKSVAQRLEIEDRPCCLIAVVCLIMEKAGYQHLRMGDDTISQMAGAMGLVRSRINEIARSESGTIYAPCDDRAAGTKYTLGWWAPEYAVRLVCMKAVPVLHSTRAVALLSTSADARDVFFTLCVALDTAPDRRKEMLSKHIVFQLLEMFDAHHGLARPGDET